MHIFLDADACPVKEEAIRVAGRYGRNITLVSNQGMRPSGMAHVSYAVVGAGFDAADDWIIEHAAAGDMVITADILLASRSLDKGCSALSPTGHIFTAHNIGNALAMRELNAHLRQTGESKGYNASFSKKDRAQFLQSMDKLLQHAK